MCFRKQTTCLLLFHFQAIYATGHCSKTSQCTTSNRKISFWIWKTGFPHRKFSWTILVTREEIPELQLGFLRELLGHFDEEVSRIACFCASLSSYPISLWLQSGQMNRRASSSAGGKSTLGAYAISQARPLGPGLGLPRWEGGCISRLPTASWVPGLLPGVCCVLPGIAVLSSSASGVLQGRTTDLFNLLYQLPLF